MSNTDVINKVATGYRIPQEQGCASDLVYAMMLKCWDEKQANRPPFQELVDFFMRLFNEAASKKKKRNEKKQNDRDAADLSSEGGAKPKPTSASSLKSYVDLEHDESGINEEALRVAKQASNEKLKEAKEAN